VKRGEIIRKTTIDYRKVCIQKFRRIVERNFLKKRKLKDYEQLNE